MTPKEKHEKAYNAECRKYNECVFHNITSLGKRFLAPAEFTVLKKLIAKCRKQNRA